MREAGEDWVMVAWEMVEWVAVVREGVGWGWGAEVELQECNKKQCGTVELRIKEIQL